MKPIRTTIAAVLLSMAFGLYASDQDQAFDTDVLTEDAVRADLAIARKALERLHAGYHRYAEPEILASRWDALDAKAAGGMDFESLYVGVSGLLAAIGCDHTKAELPPERVDAREHAPVYLPFRFRLFGRPGAWRMLVERSGTEQLVRGDEVLAIDGDPVSQRVDAVWPLIPVDGQTVHVRAHEIASSSEFLGSAWDHFDPLLRPVRPTVRLTIRRGGEARQIEANRVGYAEFRRFTEQQSRWNNFSDSGAVRVEYLNDGIAVLRVATFVNYRTPVDPAEVFDPIFSEIRERGVRRLIVDMRATGGGSVDVQEALIARLIKRPVLTVREIRVRAIDLDGLRDHLSSWAGAAMNPQPDWFVRDDDGWILKPEFGGARDPIQPHPLAHTGQLVVLTGPANSSGATTMIGAVREAGDAVLIGETTGGNQAGSTAGILYFLTLPNSGIRIRIPAQRIVTGFRDVVDGRGYAPDLARPLTLEDWRSGRDGAMDAAIGAAMEASMGAAVERGDVSAAPVELGGRAMPAGAP